MKHNLNLRVKILVLLVASFLVLGISFLFITLTHFQKYIFSELHEKAAYAVNDTASAAEDYILSDNLFGLDVFLNQRLFLDKKVRYPDFFYFFVQDKYGDILAHTFTGGFPSELKDANKLKAGEGEKTALLKTEAGYVFDIAVPIMEGRLGTAHVGLLQSYLDNIRVELFLGFLALLLITMVPIFLLFSYFTRVWFKPISELELAFESVKNGDFSLNLEVRSDDELGRLSGLFNEINAKFYEITRSRDELKKQKLDYIQSQAEFSDIINNVDIGVYRSSYGLEGTFLDANSGMLKLFEVDSKADLLKRNVTDLYVDPLKRATFFKKLQEEGKVSDTEVELMSLKGRRFWGSVTAISRRTETGEPFFYGIVEDISGHKDAQQKLKRNYDVQAVLNRVLSISLENVSIDELLEHVLNEVLDIPWLSLESKGAVFLVEDDPRTLVLKAHRNLAVPLQTICKSVEFGRCLCGRAAATGELIFSNHVDERHENIYSNMPAHGHYCVPLTLTGGRIIGVITLYVRIGYKRDPSEESFLKILANVVAAIIERKQVEGKLRGKIEEIDKLNHFMIGREKRIIELKKEIDDILKEIGRPSRYNTA